MRTVRIRGERHTRSPNGAQAKLVPRYSRGAIAILPLKIPIAQGKHLKMHLAFSSAMGIGFKF